MDGERQRFSVFFSEEGTTYRLEVSAPKERDFQGVWQRVGWWLKYQAEHQWSEENLEFVEKAVQRAVYITLLGLFEKNGTPIIRVASEEEADYLSERNPSSACYDIVGTLEDQLNSEDENQSGLVEFQGPKDLEIDIGSGVMIRLCNSLFATEIC